MLPRNLCLTIAQSIYLPPGHCRITANCASRRAVTSSTAGSCLTSTTFASALPHSNRYSTKVVASAKMLPKTREPAAPAGPDRINSDTGPIPDRRTRGRTGDGANDDFALTQMEKTCSSSLTLRLGGTLGIPAHPWAFSHEYSAGEAALA